MDNFKRRVESLVDVTAPAFLGIEDYSPQMVLDNGLLLSEQYLEDIGFEILDAAECHIVARDDEVGACLFQVISRRMLTDNFDARPEPSVPDYADLDPVKSAWEGELGEPLQRGFVAATFLSNRAVHLVCTVKDTDA